jgi:hypothetical protein
MGEKRITEDVRHELEQHARLVSEHLSHLRSPIEDLYVWCLDRLETDRRVNGHDLGGDVRGMFEHVLYERRNAESCLRAIQRTLSELG